MVNAVAARIAPHIDRLVWSVSNRVGPDSDIEMNEGEMNDGEMRTFSARRPGELNRVYHFGDFLRDGLLTDDLAMARARYRPTDETRGLLASWERDGLVRRHPDRSDAWMADGLTPVIDEMWAQIAAMAHRQWAAHPAQLDVIDSTVATLADSLNDDHAVAFTHHRVTDPTEPPARCFKRLVTARYIRQADHIRAWEAVDLRPDEAVVLTGLWHGDGIESHDEASIDRLRRRGLVDEGELTDEGRTLRNRIEDATDRRNAAVWQVAGDDGLARFEEAVAALPGHPPSAHR